MAQIKRKSHRSRALSRLGLRSKPGIAMLLVAGVVAGGAIGAVGLLPMKGFEVVTDRQAEALVQLESESTTDQEPSSQAQDEALYVVHVDGAVHSPGVYELMGSDLRIRDAVEAAGGLLEDADTTRINLAAPVVDGSKVHIPTDEEVQAQLQSTVTGSVPSQTTSIGLVNINSATAEQLCTLSGIGEATAANIIADREQNGPFTCIEDLMRVSGIGERKFERVKDSICV